MNLQRSSLKLECFNALVLNFIDNFMQEMEDNGGISIEGGFLGPQLRYSLITKVV
jgi:hypothetical protein